MAFVTNPNLPDNAVTLAVVDERISREAENALLNLGVKILKLRPHPSLYTAVCSHPDMLLHHIGGETIVYAPGTDPTLIDALLSDGFSLLKGESILSPAYPADISYNIARVGSMYFHNLKYTDPVIKRQLFKRDIEPIHVEQGYSKCSVLPVDANSIITSDAGIAKAAEKKGLEVLLVDCERSICLPGLNYGFIGGAGGMIGNSVCAINGSLDALSCSDEFSAFVLKKSIIIKELSDSSVTDIGSVLPLKML
jgi:hypothetical protein